MVVRKNGGGFSLAYHNLLLKVYDEGYAVLTVNRPQVLNALNRQTVDELFAAFNEVAQRNEIRSLVVTGAGEKSFIAGADIGEFQEVQSASQGEELARRGQELTRRIEALPKPVIMAINGFALGGGCELALAGDIRLAASTARLGQPEVNLGLMPGYGGTQRLTRLVGKGMAKYLCMTGEMISAEEAWRIGLVEKVYPQESLLNEARKLAAILAAKPSVALRLIKQAIQHSVETDLQSGLALEAGYFGISMNTWDRVEGTEAFLQKRKPSFSGK